MAWLLHRFSVDVGSVAAPCHGLMRVHSTQSQHKLLNPLMCGVLQTEDVAGVQGLAQEVAIALKGEAYAIDVAVKYIDPGAAALNYGLLKATQAATKSVTLVNTGKYAVAFAFHQRGAMMKELFNVTPAEGSLAPGAQQAVELAFNR